MIISFSTKYLNPAFRSNHFASKGNQTNESEGNQVNEAKKRKTSSQQGKAKLSANHTSRRLSMFLERQIEEGNSGQENQIGAQKKHIQASETSDSRKTSIEGRMQKFKDRNGGEDQNQQPTSRTGKLNSYTYKPRPLPK